MAVGCSSQNLALQRMVGAPILSSLTGAKKARVVVLAEVGTLLMIDNSRNNGRAKKWRIMTSNH
jgi:hypothetical protein